MNSLNFLQKINDAHPPTFALANSLLGPECKPLVSAVTYDKLELPGPQTQILQVTCPRDGECDFSQGPALQTHYIISHSEWVSPFQTFWAPFDCAASLSLTSKQGQCCNSREKAFRNEQMLREIRQQTVSSMVIISDNADRGTSAAAHWFQCQQMKRNISMSLCHCFAKGVLSDKRPIEETNLRQAITSIFLVLKGREWAMIFKLIDACKDTLKLLQ